MENSYLPKKEPKKTSRIKNPNYLRFLKEGIITILTEEQIKQALNNIKGHNTLEGRALLIALYYTGARPVEILQTKGQDIGKEGSYITIKVCGSKRGLPRTVYLQQKNPMAQELYRYATGLHPETLIFYHYRSNRYRTITNRKGQPVTYLSLSDNLYYHLKKWFTGIITDSISPYYLRHNRFSKLSAKGVTESQIRMLKGSRTADSVTPYLHMSTRASKDIARKMD